MKTAQEKLIAKLEKCTNDLERWKVIKASQDSGVIVLLDNDDTMIGFDDNEYFSQFNDFIGDAPGVPVLLDMLGIRNRGV